MKPRWQIERRAVGHGLTPLPTDAERATGLTVRPVTGVGRGERLGIAAVTIADRGHRAVDLRHTPGERGEVSIARGVEGGLGRSRDEHRDQRPDGDRDTGHADSHCGHAHQVVVWWPGACGVS